jgi:Fur family ferric uptake transcriptional regulator
MPHNDHSGVDSAIRASGRRLTGPRRRVLEVLAASPGHLTADQVRARAGEGSTVLVFSTVYRNLEALVEMGLVATFTDGTQTTYEWVAARDGNHHHLLCDDCGGVEEIEPAAIESVTRELRRRHGFVADIRHLAIHGQCAVCQQGGTSK